MSLTKDISDKKVNFNSKTKDGKIEVINCDGVLLQFLITQIDILELSPQETMEADRIKTPRIKNTALLPK